jgi:hypothetical protein
MFAKGLSETIKVLKIYFKLLDFCARLRTLTTLNVFTAAVDPPIENPDISSTTIVHVDAIAIKQSNKFHAYMKYRNLIALIFMITSKRNNPVKTLL